jgi:hypothetical protein
MSQQTERIRGLANGQEIVGSDDAVMNPGIHSSEFESVILGDDGTAYLVSAIVSARPLNSTFAAIAYEAAEELNKSPILTVRACQDQGQEIIKLNTQPVGPGELLRTLGARALANRSPK